MARPHLRELTYQTDSSAIFESLRDLPYPVFLDSAYPYSERGRYDIISAAPLHTKTISINISDRYEDILNPFSQSEALLMQLPPLDPLDIDLPFVGGLIGCFGYDGGRKLAGIGKNDSSDYQCPDFYVGLYSWAIIADHHKQQRFLVSHPDTPRQLLGDIETRIGSVKPLPATYFSLTGPLDSNLDKDNYAALFHRVQEYIRSGDCYQINLARRFTAEYQGDPWQAYKQLRMIAAAPFSSYLELPESCVLSLSPERFLEVRDNQVITTPIKGTAPRSAIPETDRALAEELQASEKNRAENLMIVDLLRNDIGHCCTPGSISVDKLFELQSFQTVHHLVSTIRGQLAANYSALDLLAACFPGGSITGAPKHRAMEIIHELEPDPRSIYCGSIAYVSLNGDMDSNIAIRTMLCEKGKLYCWSGGGVVADSSMEAEFEETNNKVDLLLNQLAKMR